MSELAPPSESEDTRLVPTSKTPTADEVAAAALARVRDVTNELVRLVRTVATQATDGWTLVSVVRPLVPELERVFEERDALDQEVAALRADVADADERIRELEAQLAARETGWAAERTALEAEAARERDQSLTLTEDLERRHAENERLTARERRVREQMETVAARAQADREETLRLAREMVQSAEEARIAVVEEMDQLRTSLVEVQHEQARVTQGAAEREVELARSRQMLEQIDASRTSAAAELTRARASLVHTESELLASQHEYQLAQVQIDKLCSAHDELVEDRAHFVARLHDAKEREARLRLRITGLEQRIQAAHDGTPVGVEAAEGAVQEATSELALELSRAEERMRQLETDLAKARATANAANLRIDGLHHQARTIDRARADADAEIHTLRATIAALENTAASVTASSPTPAGTDEASVPPVADETAVDSPVEVASAVEPASAPMEAPEACTAIDLEPFTALDDTGTTDELGATSDDVETDDPIAADELVTTDAPIVIDAGTATAEVAEPSPVAATIVVFDATDAWASDGAITVHWLDASNDVAGHVRTLDPTCCLVNLAAPRALEAVAAMRAAGIETPLWSCAGDPRGSTALPLGPLDVITRPVDPERVRARLDAFAPRGANVIMVGSESATLIPIRQGALAAGMSIRTAWNRAQAADLAAAVHPDVVIVDLISDPAAAAALVADLAGAANPPRLVIIPGSPQQLTEFATALATHATTANGAFDHATLLKTAAASTQR